jgi:hypothetical protein
LRTVLGRTLGSLRGNRPFRLLWFSNLFFFGGVWTQTLVLGWLVYETTRSDLLVAVFATHLHGRALGLQELAIGIMPVASLALGAFAEHFGVGPTTFVSAILLVGLVFTLVLRSPQLLRYGGS